MASQNNILIRDMEVAKIARQHELYLNRFKTGTSKTTSPRNGTVLPSVEDARNAKIHGINQNNLDLFFNTKQESGTNKTLITVPLAKQSKFGPAASKKKQHEYRLVKLNDKELAKVMSNETKAEITDIK